MERTHKKGFALSTIPNLFPIFKLLPVPTVPLVFLLANFVCFCTEISRFFTITTIV